MGVRLKDFIVALVAVVTLSSVTLSRSFHQSDAKTTATSSHDLSGVWLMDTDAYHKNPGYGSLQAPPMTPWARGKI